MPYFNQFPIVKYNLTGVNSNTKEVTDIWRNVKVRSKIANNVALFDRFDVPEGDSPETVAYKVYGDQEYFWVVCIMNNIVNRYYDWPLSFSDFEEYVKQKYAEPGAIHHYEKTQLSGDQSGDGPGDYSHKIEVNSTDPDAQSVSNYEYESRLQDQKRQIKLLDKGYLNTFVEEFERLVQR